MESTVREFETSFEHAVPSCSVAGARGRAHGRWEKLINRIRTCKSSDKFVANKTRNWNRKLSHYNSGSRGCCYPRKLNVQSGNSISVDSKSISQFNDIHTAWSCYFMPMSCFVNKCNWLLLWNADSTRFYRHFATRKTKWEAYGSDALAHCCREKWCV